jgi:hypothetical protein
MLMNFEAFSWANVFCDRNGIFSATLVAFAGVLGWETFDEELERWMIPAITMVETSSLS